MCFNMLKVLLILTLLKEAHSHKHSDEDIDVGAPGKYIFLFGGIIFVVIIRHLIRTFNVPVPYSLFALFLGIFWGIGALFSNPMMGVSAVAEEFLKKLWVFYLPIIIFSTSFCIDVHAFLRSLPQILIISIPVSCLTAVFCGSLMRLIINPNWSVVDGLLFGVISSMIYPLDVIRWLKETSTHTKHVTILLEGETLLGTAVSLQLYEILCTHIMGWIIHWYQFVMGIVRILVIGLPAGYLYGLITSSLMRLAYNDFINLMLLTIATSYSSYCLGEVVSDSGTVCTMFSGIMMGIERTSLSSEMESHITDLWRAISGIMNAALFVIVGVTVPKLVYEHMNVKDCILVFVTYLLWNLGRFLSFLIFSPMLSRLGYGMSFQNMVICVWSGLKNPVSLTLALTLHSVIYVDHVRKARIIFLHATFVYLLLLCINGTFLPILLKALGLAELSVARQVNMNNCMKYIFQARERTIAILKMDKFLSDANWPVVTAATNLKHPYKKGNVAENESEEEEEEYFLGYKFSVCPDCKKNVLSVPTPKELKDMTREAKMRVLKLKKISYSRQYENGMVSKEGIRIMTQAVETAMDTEEAVIQLDGLYKLFQKEGWFYRFIRNFLYYFLKTTEDASQPPRKYWRLVCYRVKNHKAFKGFIYIVIFFNVSFVVYELITEPPMQSGEAYVILEMDALFFVIYFLEFWLKIFSYSWIYIWQHGFRTYFKSYWNIMDFVVMCASFTDLLTESLAWIIPQIGDSEYYHTFFLRLCKTRYPKIIKLLDTKIEYHKAMAYELGKCYITGEEEILEHLHLIVDNEKIREGIRQNIERDRLAITKLLGLCQKDRPTVTITVKTKQAMRTILNGMGQAINELKVSGWVDDVEYGKLLKSLAERYKYVSSIKSVLPPAPKLIFYGVSWMGDDETVINFLYENANTKKFETGDIVCTENEVVDGIYILISGLFMLSYTAREAVLNRLTETGTLPIVDYMTATKYDENMSDYVISGNCVGELGTLTERSYNCTITAETQSHVYLLRREIIKRAIILDSNPVNGLECRIWKAISFRIALPILMNVPSYRSYTQENIKYILERSFMPNLSNYKIFVVSDMVEDIVLIEGMAVDVNTRDLYIGPCYIPRAVQKLILTKSSFLNLKFEMETKLLIIPARDVDEFEIMLSEEETSELVRGSSTQCLKHYVEEMKTKGSKHMKRLGDNRSRQFKGSIFSHSSKTKSRITFASSGGGSGSVSQSKESSLK